MFFLLQIWGRVAQNRFCQEVGGRGRLAQVGGGSGGERDRRMNMLQIMHTRVCKFMKLFQESGEGE
jgi:hypothetical protein